MLAMEAPLYKSYNVVALNHYGKTAEVQLGISGEKLEVTPEPQRGNIRLFSWHPKASTCNVEDIVMYELLPYKDSKFVYLNYLVNIINNNLTELFIRKWKINIQSDIS